MIDDQVLFYSTKPVYGARESFVQNCFDLEIEGDTIKLGEIRVPGHANFPAVVSLLTVKASFVDDSSVHSAIERREIERGKRLENKNGGGGCIADSQQAGRSRSGI